MDYETLVKTISEIVGNQNIEKKGLSLTYTIDAKDHQTMQDFFHQVNHPYSTTEIVYMDVFDVGIGGLDVRFIKKA